VSYEVNHFNSEWMNSEERMFDIRGRITVLFSDFTLCR